MSWNYRIVDWGDDQFDVREVHYDQSGAVTHWTANPRELTGESPDDIIGDLELMLQSVKRRPILDYRELPGTVDLASGTPTRRAETTGSVAEGDGGPGGEAETPRTYRP